MHEREILLKIVFDEAAGCNACALHETRTNSVFARGNTDADIVFVGEGPGYHEDMQGLPFVGNSGRLLNNMIKAMGYEQDEVYVCNIVKCRAPDNRKPRSSEMDACKTFLSKQLSIVDPKVIITLGSTAMEGLLGPGPGVTKRRGKWYEWQGIPVMVTFHPSYLLRNPPKKEDVWFDLQAVLRLLKKEKENEESLG